MHICMYGCIYSVERELNVAIAGRFGGGFCYQIVEHRCFKPQTVRSRTLECYFHVSHGSSASI